MPLRLFFFDQCRSNKKSAGIPTPYRAEMAAAGLRHVMRRDRVKSLFGFSYLTSAGQIRKEIPTPYRVEMAAAVLRDVTFLI